jgi:sporulation protein YlmC with PRC-barrel domain
MNQQGGRQPGPHGARVAGGVDNLSGPGPEVMAAATLRGNKVVNFQGDELGVIEEIMIDVPSGTVAYAVLAYDGFMGLANKLFAVPWEALTLDADLHCFVLDVARARLDRATGFDNEHWPAVADRTWLTDFDVADDDAQDVGR